MKKRNFLVPIATLAAAVTGGQASADIPSPQNKHDSDLADAMAQTNAQSDGKMVVKAGQDAFSFVLKRNEKNEMMAWHESHSSHASHSSHRSHYSGS